MGNKSKRRELRDYLAAEQPAAITGDVWRDLLARFKPVSESYLRTLLIETGLPFEQPWAGIRQHTYVELEQSLEEMRAVYADAVEKGDRVMARYCRRQVISAKDRARFVATNPHFDEGKRAQKEEMAAWMLVWLETPEVFPAWLAARKKALSTAPG